MPDKVGTEREGSKVQKEQHALSQCHRSQLACIWVWGSCNSSKS